jgi:hypothetical protein
MPQGLAPDKAKARDGELAGAFSAFWHICVLGKASAIETIENGSLKK